MEASVLRCSSCGANVGEDAVQCPYCRSQLASVACPSCFGMVSVRARFCSHCGAGVEILQQPVGSDLQCPGCHVKLLNTPLAGVDLHQCEQCGGIWLARDCFEALAKARESLHLSLPGHPVPAAPPPAAEAVRYRKCPLCTRFMNRVNYARISGIILDSCREHGLWFDRDELRRVLAFVEAGGLEKARQRERMKQEEDLRQKKAAAAMGPDTGGMLGEPEPLSEWAELADAGGLLGRIIVGAAGTFWRGLRK